MPQVIIAGIAYYAGYITAAQFVLVAVAAAYTADQQSRARAKAKQQFNDSLRDRLTALPTVDGRRSRVYGRVRNVDGILYKATFGAYNARYAIVYALAGHEVDGIEQVYFGDNQPVTLDAGTGQVLTAPWAGGRLIDREAVINLTNGAGFVDLPEPPQGAVQVGRMSFSGFRSFNFEPISAGNLSVSGNRVSVAGAGSLSGAFQVKYQGLQAGGQSRAFVHKFTGAPNQNVGAFLASFGVPGMSSAHKFEGIACLVAVFDYDEDAFATGLPSVSAVVRGAKVLDPRDGVTRWTENPALIARDWALNAQGGGALPEEVDTASFIAAANACDVQHRFTSVGSTGPVQTWRPIYTCGTVARTDGDPTATLAAIVESMAGDWAWCGGQLRVRAGAYSAPVADITEDWISSSGSIDIVSTAARTELVNTITSTIADAAYHYLSAPQPRLRVGAYVDKDGGEYPLDLTLEAVTDADHAGHIQGVMLRQRRQALTVQLTCNNRAYPLQVFDTVRLSLPAFGWAAKPFEVMAWQFSPQGGIRLTLRETDPSIYTPDAEFTRSDPAPNTALPDPWAVPAITALAVTSGNAELLRQADGTVLTRLRVSWAAVADEAVRVGGAVEVAVTPWNGTEADRRIVRAEGDATHVHVTGVQDGMAYVVSARARNGLVAGPWSPILAHQVLGKSAPPSDVAALTATPAPGAVRLTWTACPDADYALTELRAGTSWASATPIWRGTGNAYEWAASAGAYTVLARHEDTSGNLSTGVASVSATALASASSGQALNADPLIQQPSEWVDGGHGPLASFVTVTDGVAGANALQAGPTPQSADGKTSIPLTIGRRYRISAWVRAQGGANGAMYLRYVRRNAAGATVSQETILGVENIAPTTTWQLYSGELVATADDRYISPRLILNWTGSTGVHQAQNVRVEDVTEAYALAQAAAAAQGTANTAASNASSALSTLSTMRSNGYIDAGEKPALIRQWQAVNDERAGIVARANAFGITTERDSYTAAWDALASYLSGLSPSWSDTTQDTPITPAVDQSTWAGLYSTRQALLNRIAQVAGERAAWTGVSGRPASFVVRAMGGSASAPAGFAVGLFNAETGAAVGGSGYARSYTLLVLTRAGNVEWAQTYDVWGDGAATAGRNAATLAGDLNWHADNRKGAIVVLYSADEPQANRLSSGLPAAVYRCGGSSAVFGSSQFKFRSAYVLVGIAGCGEGRGAEVYAGEVDSDAGSWAELAFELQHGVLRVSGTTSGARTLVDYGYVGDLDATKGAPAGTYVGGILAEAVESISGAQAKANAAAAAAQSAAQTYAAAQANAADVSARAYADGIVDAEEARAILDATNKANAARAAAEAAAAADATAKADLAATTAVWTGVTGSGKPADNATRNPVYFQDSDPGGVPDGSIWISSTKARQRIGGAWQPYVGAGSVGTGELEADAATVVLTSYLAGPVSQYNDV